jgi:apolipoprotein N-acyltransferase
MRPPAWIATIASGILTGIGFVIPPMWPFALVGMTPILWVALREETSPRRAFLHGFLFGFVLYACALYGIFWSVVPLDWAGIGKGVIAQYVFSGAAWAMTAATLALATGAWAWIVRSLRANRWTDIALAPSAWVLAEFIGAFLFSLENYGKGDLIGAHFSLGFLGNLLADDFALRQAAWLGGVYLLSAIIVAANVCILRFCRGARLERRIVAILALAAMIAWGVGDMFVSRIALPTSPAILVGAIHSHMKPALSVSDEIVTGYLAEQTDLLRSAALRGADIVVFPEGADALDHTIPFPAPWFPDLKSDAPVVIDSSAVAAPDGNTFSEMRYYDSETGMSAYTYKRFLLPVGEYMPLAERILADALGDGKAIDRIAAARDYESGPDIKVPVVRGIPIFALFCDEIFSPELYREATREGASILFAAAAEDWFHDSGIVYAQVVRAGRIRAVENHRFLVEAANESPSFALDWYGRTIGASGWATGSVLYANVTPSNETTPYAFLGPWELLLPLGIVAALALARRRV